MSLWLMLVMAITGSTAFEARGVQETTTNAGPEDAARPLYTHVRSGDRYFIALIRRGYDRSPTFRALVDTLQHSNVIVRRRLSRPESPSFSCQHTQDAA